MIKQDGNKMENEDENNKFNYFLFQSQYPLLFTTLNDDPK
jgi:hypothetical protein